MTRWMMLVFATMTLGATLLTYNNIGLEKTQYEEPSVRSGSSRIGGMYGIGGGGGGYSYGK